jgi:hypothetical protein
VAFKEMTKGHEQFLRVPDASCATRLMNIVDDHCADRFAPMRLFQEIVSQGAGCDLRNMLVLPYRRHFVFAQTAKSDAVFQGDHDALPSLIPTHYVVRRYSTTNLARNSSASSVADGS